MKEELKIFNDIVDELLKLEEVDPVVKLGAPEKMVQKFDISVGDDPMSEEDFRAVLGNVVLNTPRTASRSFFNQLFGGRMPAATLGELLSVMLNISMYTYKVGGPNVGIETELTQQLCRRIGYPDFGSGGTFAPGGSMSNFMSMLMARDACDSEIKEMGMRKQLVIYTSQEAHYSVAKNAMFSGIGRENIRYLPVNDRGQIETSLLENMIIQDRDNGLHPCLINATAGTTVLGAFDDLDTLGDIAKRQHVWFHVDGAYGGSVIFSEKYKHLVKGLEKSDSFTINPHKMLGTPLSCSMIVTRHKQQLLDSFSQDASYLYQGDSDDYNLGKTSLQCGRRNDAFKFWTLWKSIGTNGLEKIIDQLFHLADVAREYVRKHPDYTLYSFEESTAICFNYKAIPADKICNALSKKGKLMVGYGLFKEDTFVRFVTVNSLLTEGDIVRFFDQFEEFAASYDFD
ncbi:MAG: pyridoxal phosphate-dependent decarboxylase family protein [Akkermansiaceae bacterium]